MQHLFSDKALGSVVLLYIVHDSAYAEQVSTTVV